MYYVYYCGTGLITAIIYGLLVITLSVYCYVEESIPSFYEEEFIIYASLACISFLFSIIIGSINQIRIKKTKKYFY